MRRLELFAVTVSFWLALGCTYYSGDCDPDPFDDRCLFGDCRPDPDPLPRDGGMGLFLDAPVAGCVDATDCRSEELCIEGSCRPESAVCRSDLDCGPGRGCVDNACRPLCLDDGACDGAERCVAAHCVPEPECITDGDCSMELCVGGRCSGRCVDATTCPRGELCEAGVCRPDVAPRSFCATDDDCAPGHPCVNGVCRTVCPSGTDDECQRADVQLVTCAPIDTRLLCLARSESHPECRVAGDCAAGSHCIDALCR